MQPTHIRRDTTRKNRSYAANPGCERSRIQNSRLFQLLQIAESLIEFEPVLLSRPVFVDLPGVMILG